MIGNERDSRAPQRERVYVRTAVFRVPAAAGAVLAIPALFLVGAVAVAALAAGAAALLLGPALLRAAGARTRRDEDATTVTLDPSAYRTVDRPPVRLIDRAPTGGSAR